MEMHLKKKVEIIVEAVQVKRMLDMIEASGGKGFTVIPEVSGKGHRGVRDEAHVSDVFRNVLIIVIAAEDVAKRIIQNAQPLLENYAGIITVTDTQVVRDEHF